MRLLVGLARVTLKRWPPNSLPFRSLMAWIYVIQVRLALRHVVIGKGLPLIVSILCYKALIDF